MSKPSNFKGHVQINVRGHTLHTGVPFLRITKASYPVMMSHRRLGIALSLHLPVLQIPHPSYPEGCTPRGECPTQCPTQLLPRGKAARFREEEGVRTGAQIPDKGNHGSRIMGAFTSTGAIHAQHIGMRNTIWRIRKYRWRHMQCVSRMRRHRHTRTRSKRQDARRKESGGKRG